MSFYRRETLPTLSLFCFLSQLGLIKTKATASLTFLLKSSGSLSGNLKNEDLLNELLLLKFLDIQKNKPMKC